MQEYSRPDLQMHTQPYNERIAAASTRDSYSEKLGGLLIFAGSRGLNPGCGALNARLSTKGVPESLVDHSTVPAE